MSVSGRFKVLFDFGWPYKGVTYGSVRHLEIELPDCITEAPTATNEVP